MKYFLLVLVSFIFFTISSSFIPATAHATIKLVPSAHCLSNKPCSSTVNSDTAPSTTVPSGTSVSGQPNISAPAVSTNPSSAPAVSSAPSIGTPNSNTGASCQNLSQFINKLSNTSSAGVNAKIHIKCHGNGGGGNSGGGNNNGGGNNGGINPNNGELSKLLTQLIQLLLQLLQLCGVSQPSTGTPAPSVSPVVSQTPSQASSPSGGAGTQISQSPSSQPSSAPKTGSGSATTGSGTALSLNGVKVMKGNTRFIFKGVNLEYYRDPNNQGFMSSEVPLASQIVAKMKSIGINAVRLDYRPSYVDNGNNMANYLAMLKLLATNGIYVLPSDHSYTNGTISGYTTTSFPDFKTIIDYAKQQGLTNYVIMNPYNESNGSESSWISAYKATLQYFRTTLGYKGIVVIDTNGWAISDNTSSFQTIMSYDASLLGGKSNIIFSNHEYPGYDYQTPMSLSKTYPLLFGELGNNVSGGYSSSGEVYVNQMLAAEISTGIPNGNNGVFPWIWWWTDGNQMTDNGLTLNSVGQAMVTNYYSKVSN